MARPQRILYVCGKGRMRSPTAAHCVADRYGVETDFAGSSRDADEIVTPDAIGWADCIAVMERRHAAKLNADLGRHLKGKRIVCLDIPDRFGFMEAGLVDLILRKIRPILGPPAQGAIARSDTAPHAD